MGRLNNLFGNQGITTGKADRITISGGHKDMANALRELGLGAHPDILILGEGNIGEKANNFLKKTDIIHTAGLCTTSKILLGGDFCEKCDRDEKFLSRNIEGIADYYNDTPILAVRSSGQGDATGVGVYKSFFVKKNAKNIAAAIKKVCESNRAPTAVAYRKKLGITSEEIGIMIEPCLGRSYDDDLFGPELSGRGEAQKNKELRLGVAAGLAGGVEDRDYFPVTGNKYTRLGTIAEEIRSLLPHERQTTHANLVRNYLRGENQQIATSLYHAPTDTMRAQRLSPEFSKKIFNYSLRTLQKSMNNIVEELREPQYFEWAAMLDKNNKWKTYITQIADDVVKNFQVDLKNQPGTCIGELGMIVRSGVKDFSKVLVINIGSLIASRDWKEDLLKYNQENKGYLLVISDEATFGDQKLGFEYFSNAGAIIETGGFHAGAQASHHYIGLLSKTDILFAMTHKDRLHIQLQQLVSQSYGKSHYVKEISGYTFRLAQDEKQGKGKLLLLK